MIRNKDAEIRPFGQRFNIWEMATVSQKGDGAHPAPFPLALANDHILSWSNPGDVVFDPFLGSGTTGVAALRSNRRFIGIERDPDYFAIARSRIKPPSPFRSPAAEQATRAAFAALESRLRGLVPC